MVLILAGLPLLPLSQMVSFDTTTFSISLIEGRGKEGGSTLDMLYHISGEFAIRWMTAVLTCTPFFILFGIQNLFVRQAMGIATGVWSLLHFIIFLMAEGFLSTFDELNYIMGFIAVAILVPLLVTSNRKSMKKLKSTWKKLQSWVYLAVILSLLHVALLEKTWLIYALIVAIGFILRITPIKNRIIAFRTSRKN